MFFEAEDFKQRVEDIFGIEEPTIFKAIIIYLVLTNFITIIANTNLIVLHIWLRAKGLTTYDYILSLREKARSRRSKINPNDIALITIDRAFDRIDNRDNRKARDDILTTNPSPETVLPTYVDTESHMIASDNHILSPPTEKETLRTDMTFQHKYKYKMATGAYARFQVVNGRDVYVSSLPFRVGEACKISQCGHHPVFLFDYDPELSEYTITLESRSIFLNGESIKSGTSSVADMSMLYWEGKRGKFHVFYLNLPKVSQHPTLIEIPQDEDASFLEDYLLKKRRLEEGCKVNPAKKSKTKLIVPRDEEGNIIFPLQVNNSLTILSLGEIEVERPSYHTDRNIFPIGYKSIREHSSYKVAGERMQYLCEIFDGGAKPLFKVTPLENGVPDESQAIDRDSCTGSWIVICNKVNDLQKSRRSKVTVSGTDRFGLWDPNVIKLIHNLPGADLLVRKE